VTAGGLPLVSITAPGNELDQTHLVPLLWRFRELYGESLPVADLLLDKGYDVEALYETAYEDFGMIAVTSRKENIAYPDGFSKKGRPLCPYGIELVRRGTDYGRRRTKFCCEHRCRASDAEPDDGFEDCVHLSGPGAGFTYYTHFEWGYRKFGPLAPDMDLFAKLYRLRTDVERGFGLTKANRYRMEDNITVMGLDALAIHVILHYTAVVIDALYRGVPPLRPAAVTPTA
jgi:hypothetical protein